MRQSAVRQNIVETASRLFYQNGYNLTGVNEIIKEAGIAKATLYSHFRSKEDICLAYLSFKEDTFRQAIADHIAGLERGRAQILGIFDFLQSFFEDKDFNGCWCLNTVSELPKENEKIRRKIQNNKTAFLRWIGEVVKQNLPNKSFEEHDFIAKQVYLLYETALSESHLHQNDWPIAAAKKMCKSLI